MGEVGEEVLPDALLLLEGAGKALDETVLLGCVGRDESLFEPVLPARRSEAAGLEDEAVIGAHFGRGASWAGMLKRRMGVLRWYAPPEQGELCQT